MDVPDTPGAGKGIQQMQMEKGDRAVGQQKSRLMGEDTAPTVAAGVSEVAANAGVGDNRTTNTAYMCGGVDAGGKVGREGGRAEGR